MKKLIGLMLAMVLVFVLVVLAAEAKPYKAVGIPDYTVEVPECFAIPFDPGKLNLSQANQMAFPSGEVAIASLFVDPTFQYFGKNKEGNIVEVSPYVEIVKMEGDKLHVIAILFINNDGDTEIYIDEPGHEGPACDKLEKAGQEFKFMKGVVKVPREKKN